MKNFPPSCWRCIEIAVLQERSLDASELSVEVSEREGDLYNIVGAATEVVSSHLHKWNKLATHALLSSLLLISRYAPHRLRSLFSIPRVSCFAGSCKLDGKGIIGKREPKKGALSLEDRFLFA